MIVMKQSYRTQSISKNIICQKKFRKVKRCFSLVDCGKILLWSDWIWLDRWSIWCPVCRTDCTHCKQHTTCTSQHVLHGSSATQQAEKMSLFCNCLANYPSQWFQQYFTIKIHSLHQLCPWPWSLIVFKNKFTVLGPGLGSPVPDLIRSLKNFIVSTV